MQNVAVVPITVCNKTLVAILVLFPEHAVTAWYFLVIPKQHIQFSHQWYIFPIVSTSYFHQRVFFRPEIEVVSPFVALVVVMSS